MKKWYDGYTVGEVQSVYNPYSVICAAKKKKYTSYWRQTSAADNLLTYIEMDEEGLQGDIAQLIAGETIEINTSSFKNDVTGFKLKDDVLTLPSTVTSLGDEAFASIYREVCGFSHIELPEGLKSIGESVRTKTAASCESITTNRLQSLREIDCRKRTASIE